MNVVMTGSGAVRRGAGHGRGQAVLAPTQLAQLTALGSRGDRRRSTAAAQRADARPPPSVGRDPGRSPPRNPGKLRELARCSPAAALDAALARRLSPDAPAVDETATTYADNARAQGARRRRAHAALPALADDSGLEVDALGGAPGVRSARFAGDAGRGADGDDAPTSRCCSSACATSPTTGARRASAASSSSPGPTAASWSPRAPARAIIAARRAAAAASATIRSSVPAARPHLRRARRRGEGPRQPPRPRDRRAAAAAWSVSERGVGPRAALRARRPRSQRAAFTQRMASSSPSWDRGRLARSAARGPS